MGGLPKDLQSQVGFHLRVGITKRANEMKRERRAVGIFGTRAAEKFGLRLIKLLPSELHIKISKDGKGVTVLNEEGTRYMRIEASLTLLRRIRNSQLTIVANAVMEAFRRAGLLL